MANISQAMTKQMLEWSLSNMLSPTRPAACFAGLATGAPTSIASSEIATASGYARSTLIMQSTASTPSGSATATNTSGVTFGPFSAAQSISGIFISDTVSSGAGQGLWFGNLAVARTVASGDSLVVASAALTITLS